MGYVLSAVVALLVLAVTMTAALHGATRFGARVFGVAGFRWFAPAPADAALGRRAGMRALGALGPYAVCVLLYFVARLVSGDELPSTKVTVPDGPARDAGMLDGDRIRAIDGKPIRTWEELRQTVRERRGPRRIEVERGTSRTAVTVTPNEKGSIGVMAMPERVPVGAGDALGGAVAAPFTFFGQLVSASSGEPAQLAGPVAIVKSTTGQRQGAFLLLVALLATMLWPFVAGVHAFDAITLAVFRRSSAAATHAASERPLRLARRKQALLVALVCLVLATVTKLLGDVMDPGPLVLLPFLVVPGALAHYPLVWLLSKELEGTSVARLKLALCALAPCAGLVVGALLLGKASRELAPAPPAAT